MRVTYDYQEFMREVKTIRRHDRLRSLGLNPESLVGYFWPNQIHELFELCSFDKRFHIVTCLGHGIFVNHYDDHGVFFEVAEGCEDPDYMLNDRHNYEWLLASHSRKCE